MGAIAPQALYEEFRDDPSTIGYAIGNGYTFTEKQNEINLVRGTIQVTRKAQDTPIGPGEVSEPIPVQVIRDAIDFDEYKLNCDPAGGDTDIVIGQKASLRNRIGTFYGGSSGESNFA